MIPETTREALLAAMERFDREERGTDDWKDWGESRSGSHRYAVSHAGRLYPVKRIISAATGVPRSGFSGADEANDYIRRYGFGVVPLRRGSGPSVWWVNQRENYDEERAAGVIQAPLPNKDGRSEKYWDTLHEVQVGNVVVHYKLGFVRALSRAVGDVETLQDAEGAGGLSDGRGLRRVRVEYAELQDPIPLGRIAADLAALDIRDGPLVQSGDGIKQAYLCRFTADGLRMIRAASNEPWPAWTEVLLAVPRSWIFQANPEIYDLTAAVAALEEITWSVRQHGDEIRPDDRVFLWESGPDAGIVAVATILEGPAELTAGEDERRFYRDPNGYAPARLQVRLRVDRALPKRIRRKDLLDHPELRDLTILQLGRGTNFVVTPEQAAILLTLMVESAPEVLDVEPTAEGKLAYADILRSLEADGLHFPVDVVSNYLLALQTKRFVILTGISGTGKTQLALAVARQFRPRVRVASPRQAPEGAVAQQVLPYMVKYHRLVLPSALRANLTLPPLDLEKNSGMIEVVYPQDRTRLRFYKDPDRPVIELLFSGEFKTWFETHLEVGDHFHLDVEARDGEGQDRLRFSLPATQTSAELLDTYEVIAVRPDWTDNRGLLGYFNPLTAQYSTTPLLELLLRARDECEQAKREHNRRPHSFFVVLDEMNLAHAEHYFSDFLSAMESGEKLHLHSDAPLEAGEGAEGVSLPRRLAIPTNVFFTGTVNVDETTSMFSPKVLDRAFTIELDRVDLAGYGAEAAGGDDPTTVPLFLRAFPGALEPWRRPAAEDWQTFGELLGGELRRVVIDLHGLLARDHRHFGYRVANEIARFVTLAAEQAGDRPETLWAALDLAILEKVLPKFHGTQQELEAPLRGLLAFMVAGHAGKVRGGSPSDAADGVLREGRLERATAAATEDIAGPRLPCSAAKVSRMLDRLKQQGFTAFIE